MNQATQAQREDTAQAEEHAYLRIECDPHLAVRKRLAVVASELRKAAETAEGSREGLLNLALRFEQHARGEDQ